MLGRIKTFKAQAWKSGFLMAVSHDLRLFKIGSCKDLPVTLGGTMR